MKHLLSKQLNEEIQLDIKKRAAALIDDGVDPQVAVILVGAHPDSVRYVSIKTRVAKEAGVMLSLYHLEEDCSFEEIQETIQFLNTDSEIHGIILQLPLPNSFTSDQTNQLLKLVVPEKDVDGLTGAWKQSAPKIDTTAELLVNTVIIPPIVEAVISLLDYYKIEFLSKKIVLVGKGRLVGGPLEVYFNNLGVEVVSVDEETDKILDITKTADIIISGTGQKDLLTYQWIKEKAVVIDCAEDIHEDSVTQVASALAPSRGGIGPLTVAWLLHNTVQAAALQKGSND